MEQASARGEGIVAAKTATTAAARKSRRRRDGESSMKGSPRNDLKTIGGRRRSARYDDRGSGERERHVIGRGVDARSGCRRDPGGQKKEARRRGEPELRREDPDGGGS